MKKIEHLIFIGIISLITLVPINVNADQFENNKVVPKNKVWKINFNREVKFDDNTKNSILVLDENNTKINVKLSLDNCNKSILIYPPNEGYRAGKYNLLIKDSIYSTKNKKLKKQTSMNFNVESDILEIKSYNIDVYEGTNYNLPKTVVVVFKDGRNKKVPVKWDHEYIDGSKVGKFVYYGIVDGTKDKAQTNINVKPMRTIYDLNDYLNKCYGSIDTPAGKIIFKYNILQNNVDFNPYDIWVQTRISPYSQVKPMDLQHSIKISDEDKQKTMRILKELQVAMSKDILRYFPNKKIKGGYFDDGYRYEYIHEGYWNTSFFTWTNYNHNEGLDNYKNTNITEFNWFDRYDNYKLGY
ncbi:hypothetical protein FDG04_02400 [Clostridium sporogenes]|uniref:Ig-like domain-containing protein n=1 Tax=Clostridium sporogenes TaxID=1509 RepID=UPI0013D8B7D4|nr:Ig-like domain-containing protein [Clostridium sporogenes]NFQ84184.1 hypothetical protein [Clostridium sporogenes]